MEEQSKTLAVSVRAKEFVSYHCSCCGHCCRHIEDCVMVESLDAYRMAKHLRNQHCGISSTDDVLLRYCEPMPLTDEGYPIYVLKTVGADATCIFLRENQCSIYAARPRTCRLYPFSVGPGERGRDFEYCLCFDDTVGGSFIDRRCQPLNFHETIYGHRFFEAQLPNLIKAMERIADGLAHLEAGSPQSAAPTSSFLHDLYYGDYEPSVFKTQSSEQEKMDKSVSAAEAALRNILQKSPSAIKAFEAYQIAVGEQHGAVTEQAFESGFQTAFQMLLAGLPLPEGTHDDEFPLTLQELRKMNGQRVFCLETNEEVQVVAYKKGFIRVTNDKENLPIHGLTLYRRRPSWCE